MFLLLLLGAGVCAGGSVGSSSVVPGWVSSSSCCPSPSSASGPVGSSSCPPCPLVPAPVLAFPLANSFRMLSIRVVSFAISGRDCLFSSASSVTAFSRFSCLSLCTLSVYPTCPSWPSPRGFSHWVELGYSFSVVYQVGADEEGYIK